MAKGKDERHNPRRRIYQRPDGGSSPVPLSNSTVEEWDRYHAAKAHARSKWGKKEPKPYDPFLDTWA